MTAMSDNMKGILVEAIFRTADFSEPSVLAMALLTTAPIDSDTAQFTIGTGVEVVPASGAYARKNHAAGAANWGAVSSGATDNTGVITFDTATDDWSGQADIVAVAICDNVTYDTGNVYFWGLLDDAKPVYNGDTAEFADASLSITFA